MVEREEVAKVEFYQGLEEAEEVLSYLRETVEVTGNEGKAGGENHFYEFAQKIAVENHVQFFEDDCKKGDELLIFGFWDALFEIVKEFSEREDKCIKNVVGLLESEVIALFQHASVDLYNFLLDHSHGLNCHEI